MKRTSPPRYIVDSGARPCLVRALLALNTLLVSFVVAAFLAGAAVLAIEDIRELLLYLLFAAVPFLAVSVMRRLVDLPRPYEVWELSPPSRDAKCGRSFPSRHVASAFLIATLLLGVYVPLSVASFAAAAAIAAIRVLVGIHFVRDVLAGAAIGIVGGMIPIILQIFVN